MRPDGRRRLARGLAIAALALGASGALEGAGAQAIPAPRTAADSVFARARQLVVSGNGAAGRVLVDSMVTAAEPNTPAYADALYWRAALAATSVDAERDYRRIVVEYPLAARAADALFQLAQLEMARGDRSSAESHLDRLLAEYPTFPQRERAGVLLVRTAFDANDLARGCGALKQTLASIPESSVELRNQLDYYTPRCNAFEAEAARTARAASKTDSTRGRGDEHRESNSESKGAAHFTLQVAAYSTKAEAERLVKRLSSRDVDARVAGSKKPYRVRIGRYATRAAAAAAAKKLKAKKIDAIVVDIGPDDR